jgi:hypothetical protein
MFDKKLKEEIKRWKDDFNQQKQRISFLENILATFNKEIENELISTGTIKNSKVYCKNCYYYHSYCGSIWCNSLFNKFIKEDYSDKNIIYNKLPKELNKYNNCNLYLKV